MATKRQKHMVGDEYEVSMLQDFLENIESEPFYLGKITHNNGKYCFKDDGRFNVHTNERITRRMGCVHVRRPLIGEDSLVLLTPAVENERPRTIEANGMSCLFDIDKLNGSVTRLSRYEQTKLSAAEL